MVRAEVRRWHERLGPGLFGLACSGGADSMALADAAIDTCGAVNVLIIHVDHGLSPGSAAVAAGVADWAHTRGVAAVVKTVVVEPRASLEAAARDARYAALSEVAAETGASWIFLAHTARDQAETVLMRILRGTGPAGLAGIPVLRPPFARPLLELPRSVIDGYVAARELPTWSDPMNTDERLARVRVRRRHLPALREENPSLDDVLCRLAASAREWAAAIDVLARPLASFPIDCRGVVSLPPAVRKRIYALALENEGLGYDAVHLDQLDALALRDAAGEVGLDVPGGRVVRSYDRLDLDRPTTAPELVPPPGYVMRTWQDGDRMNPARLKGRSRKLSDLFIDAKIPREQRRSARVVIRPTDQVIVWAEHIGIAYGETDAVVPLPNRTGEVF